MSTIKDFIYFDDDCITSYMAQINDGQIEQEFLGTTVASNDTTENIDESKEFTMSANLSGNIIAIKGDVKLLEKFIPASSNTYLSNLEIGKEYAIKKVHDNAYNRFEKYLKANDLLSNPQSSKPNDYVLLNERIKIFDIQQISSIANNDVVEKLMLQDAEEMIKNEISALKSQKNLDNKKTMVKQLEQNLCETKKEISKNLESLQYAFSLVKEFLPTDIIIVTDMYIIPIKQDFLRDDIKMFAFKHDNQKVHILGKISRKFSSSDDEGIYSSIVNPVLQECLEAFSIRLEGKYIISPVAIYC